MQVKSRDWSRECWRLHEELNARVHALVSEPAIRATMIRLVEHSANREFDNSATALWDAERQAYFEQVAAADDTRLNADATVGDNFVWQHHSREVTRRHVRNRSIPTAARHFFSKQFASYTGIDCTTIHSSPLFPKAREDQCVGLIHIHAWAPVKFLPDLRPGHKLPLPPSAGREYEIDEIAHALALLHDADGGFGAIIEPVHPLRANAPSHYNFRLNLLGTPLDSPMSRGRSAVNEWVPSLLPLLEKLEQELAREHGQTRGQPVRKKRSTAKGEARTKLISALTLHHKYEDGGCLNFDPIENNKLAHLASVDKGSASKFFAKEFGGHSEYKRGCRNKGIADELKRLNGDFATDLLYGSEPPERGRRRGG